MDKSTLYLFLLLVPGLVLLISPRAIDAQEHGQEFVEIKGFRCQWDRIAAVKIDGDSVGFDVLPWDTNPQLTINFILDIDLVKENMATFVGNLGSTKVRAFATPMGLFFVETSDIGAVHLTTIYPYKVGSTGKYLGTLSRNWALGVPMPSLTHGLCQPWEKAQERK